MITSIVSVSSLSQQGCLLVTAAPNALPTKELDGIRAAREVEDRGATTRHRIVDLSHGGRRCGETRVATNASEVLTDRIARRLRRGVVLTTTEARRSTCLLDTRFAAGAHVTSHTTFSASALRAPGSTFRSATRAGCTTSLCTRRRVARARAGDATKSGAACFFLALASASVGIAT